MPKHTNRTPKYMIIDLVDNRYHVFELKPLWYKLWLKDFTLISPPFQTVQQAREWMIKRIAGNSFNPPIQDALYFDEEGGEL